MRLADAPIAICQAKSRCRPRSHIDPACRGGFRVRKVGWPVAGCNATTNITAFETTAVHLFERTFKRGLRHRMAASQRTTTFLRPPASRQQQPAREPQAAEQRQAAARRQVRFSCRLPNSSQQQRRLTSTRQGRVYRRVLTYKGGAGNTEPLADSITRSLLLLQDRRGALKLSANLDEQHKRRHSW